MGVGRTALGLVRLVRPGNAILAAVGVVAGILVSSGWGAAPAAARVLAPVSAFLVTGFGNVLNDLRDIDVDRLAHPLRPLPSGHVSRGTATKWAAALVSMGLAASLLAGALTFLFAVAVVAVLLLYEWRLKRGGLAGNVAVAALTASTFLFGAVAAWPASTYTTTWVVGAAATMAFLANLAREITKDIEDVDADRSVRRTLPMLVGNQTAGLLAAAAACVAVVASWPFYGAAQGEACGNAWRSASLWFIVAADGAVMAGGVLAPWRAGWAQRLLKVGMALALLGFLAWPLLRTHCPQGFP